MSQKILLTSFQTWLPHQASNASDDLLEEIAKLDTLSPSLIFLRQLPVDVSQATSQVITQMKELQPDAIICCGMAERRPKLTVESCATYRNALHRIRLYHYCLSVFQRFKLKSFEEFLQSLFGISDRFDSILLKTTVNLENLLAGLSGTEISHDAGKFVCEGLYYEVLKYLREHNLNTPCIFVHVPVLTPDNLSVVVSDFRLIVDKMLSSSYSS